jgi:fatty acid desaturase
MAKEKVFFWDELLTFLLPAVMTLLGANPIFSLHNLVSAIVIWTAIMIVGSFVYSVIAINAGHHGYNIVHEGDEFKSLDFGIYQLGATIDRIETNDNLPIALASFGNHTLHHLFPSLDHALLPQLRGILLETCAEFEWEIKQSTLLHALVEQFKQLGRTHVMSVTAREAYGRKKINQNAKINCAINQLTTNEANNNSKT